MLNYSSFKKTVFIITIVAILFSKISSAQTASPDCQIPVVTGANNWYPYSYVDDQNIHQGIGFDVVELIFADLNIPIKYRFGLPWIRAMEEVNQGSIDILVANYWTEDRAEKLVMSTEIARESLNIFTLKTKPFVFKKWDDLKKQRGAMPRGMALGETFKKYSQDIDLIEVNTHQQIFKMLNKERVDYVLLAQYSAQPNLIQKENENVVMQNTPVNYYSVRISFSKNSSCLHLFNQFEQALAERINDGSVAKIISTYISN
ncbi:MAG: transporter substrate-binding domain-containing protein [Colwellia sp.]|nr:transporter substrate-binding domain-containing protein [Colwellia sp.]